MQFEVQMWAFTESKDDLKKRTVEIPSHDIREFNKGNTFHKLGMIYYYGQNDFQPRECPSVSMGDVIELDNELWLVKASGFRKLMLDEFQKYISLSQRDRHFHPLLWET